MSVSDRFTQQHTVAYCLPCKWMNEETGEVRECPQCKGPTSAVTGTPTELAHFRANVLNHLAEAQGVGVESAERSAAASGTPPDPLNPPQEEAESLIMALQTRYPAAFHPIIRRHGAEVFQFCWLTGGLGGSLVEIQASMLEALTIISGAPSKSKQAIAIQTRYNRAANVLTSLTNVLAQRLQQAAGLDRAAIAECTQDIQRASQLMQASPGVGPAGLVLPPH